MNVPKLFSLCSLKILELDALNHVPLEVRTEVAAYKDCENFFQEAQNNILLSPESRNKRYIRNVRKIFRDRLKLTKFSEISVREFVLNLKINNNIFNKSTTPSFLKEEYVHLWNIQKTYVIASKIKNFGTRFGAEIVGIGCFLFTWPLIKDLTDNSLITIWGIFSTVTVCLLANIVFNLRLNFRNKIINMHVSEAIKNRLVQEIRERTSYNRSKVYKWDVVQDQKLLEFLAPSFAY